jgi:hypothetical protein
MLVEFRHRSSKPTQVTRGFFYWIDTEDKQEIWFAPTTNVDDMLLLTNEDIIERLEELESKVSNNEESIQSIQETLGGIKDEILGEIESTYAKKTDIPNLTWKII